MSAQVSPFLTLQIIQRLLVSLQDTRYAASFATLAISRVSRATHLPIRSFVESLDSGVLV